MLLPSAFYVVLRYPAVTKVTTLVKQKRGNKPAYFMQKCGFIFMLFDYQKYYH